MANPEWDNYKPVENPNGGRRQPQSSRLDLIPVEGLLVEGEAMAEGEKKYSRLDADPLQPNWHGLDCTTEQSPLSHALKHLALYAAGDESEDHLGHARANLGMLCWFRDNPKSRYYGMTYPEILATGVRSETNATPKKDREVDKAQPSMPEDWSKPAPRPEPDYTLPGTVVDPSYPVGSPGRHYAVSSAQVARRGP